MSDSVDPPVSSRPAEPAAAAIFDADDNDEDEQQQNNENQEEENEAVPENDIENALADMEPDEPEVEEEESEDPELLAKFSTSIRGLFAQYKESINKKILFNELKTEFGDELVDSKRDVLKNLIRIETENAIAIQKEAEDEQPLVAEAEEGEAAEYLDREGSDEDDYLPEGVEGDGDDNDDDDYNPSNRGESKKRQRAGSDSDDHRGGESRKKSKKKKKKQTDEPKRPRSAYIWFVAEHRSQFARENPTLGLPEISKHLAEQWKLLPEPEKQNYHDKAIEDKRRYEREVADLAERNPELHEKLFGKTKGTKKSKNKKKRKSEIAGDDENSGGSDDEKKAPLSQFDEIVESLKHRRAMKSELKEEDQVQLDMLFLTSMSQAADEDEAAIRNGQPAVRKLKFLPKVIEQLSKRHVSLRFIDDAHKKETAEGRKVRPLLFILRRWLQFSGGQLPNIAIRSAIYKILDSLPIGESHLDQSDGLGVIMMKLWRHPKESDENKKLIGGMIERWMRPLLKVKTNWKDLADCEEDEIRKLEIGERAELLDMKKPLPRLATSRAAIPEPANFDYAIRPQSNVDRDEEEEEDLIKKDHELTRKQRMTKKLDKMRKTAGTAVKTRYRVDVAGGKTNLT